MTTTTITHKVTEYAVQVEFEPGTWLFVVGNDPENPEVYYEIDEARQAASIWAKDRVRVVTRNRTVRETPWKAVK